MPAEEFGGVSWITLPQSECRIRKVIHATKGQWTLIYMSKNHITFIVRFKYACAHKHTATYKYNILDKYKEILRFIISECSINTKFDSNRFQIICAQLVKPFVWLNYNNLLTNRLKSQITCANSWAKVGPLQFVFHYLRWPHGQQK